MGPVDLQDIKASDRLFPNSAYARRNAQAAKILGARELSPQIIMSGYESNSEVHPGVSEARLQADTYARMQATFLPAELRPEAQNAAERSLVLEPEAETTFANIIRSINLLDKEHRKLFDGSIAILSSRFHTPRIAEMIKAFGLSEQASVLSSEEIMDHYGYKNINPVGFEERENKTYKNQPGGLQNLQDNPSYVLAELAKVDSNERFFQMASSIKRYYTENDVPLPECFDTLPDQYDDSFDSNILKLTLRKIPFSKHPYTGTMTGTEYKELAHLNATHTTELLNKLDPNPPTVSRQPLPQAV